MTDSRYCGECETDGALRDVDDRLQLCVVCGHQTAATYPDAEWFEWDEDATVHDGEQYIALLTDGDEARVVAHVWPDTVSFATTDGEWLKASVERLRPVQ